MKKQSGFTLIELVVVVVILGLLAVTAIPRFVDLTDQAKQANIEGMAGGFATGVSLVRAQWEAEGRPTVNDDNSVVYDGTTVYLTTPADNNDPDLRPGYPMSSDGTASASGAMNDARCEFVWTSILSQPPSLANTLAELNNGSSQYYVDIEAGTGANGNAICIYYLVDSLAKDANGDYEEPSGNTGIGNNFTYDPANSSVVININQ